MPIIYWKILCWQIYKGQMIWLIGNACKNLFHRLKTYSRSRLYLFKYIFAQFYKSILFGWITIISIVSQHKSMPKYFHKQCDNFNEWSDCFEWCSSLVWCCFFSQCSSNHSNGFVQPSTIACQLQQQHKTNLPSGGQKSNRTSKACAYKLDLK